LLAGARTKFDGADDGIRTRDLRFTKPLLYQLSYIGAEVGDSEDGILRRCEQDAFRGRTRVRAGQASAGAPIW
jgi:hypothetical protein